MNEAKPQREGKPAPQAVDEWEQHADDESGSVYFWNPRTGESRWDLPEEVGKKNEKVGENDEDDDNDDDNDDGFHEVWERRHRHPHSSQKENPDKSSGQIAISVMDPSKISDILETEEERLTKKFEQWKVHGTIVRESNGWREYESVQGARFFGRVGSRGGQWKEPQDMMKAATTATPTPPRQALPRGTPGRTSSSSKSTPKPPTTPNPYLSRVTASNETTPLAGFGLMQSPQGTLQVSPTPPRSKRHGSQKEIETGNETGKNKIPSDNLPQFEGYPRQWQDVTYTQQNEHPVALDDEEDEDEYGNNWTKLGNDGNVMAGFESDAFGGEEQQFSQHQTRRRDPSSLLSRSGGKTNNISGDGISLMRNRVDQSAAQTHYQELYKNMRRKDRLVDKEVDVEELENRIQSAKHRWERFMQSADEETDREEMIQQEEMIADRFSSKDGADLQHLYSSMYARAVVVRLLTLIST